MNKKIIYINKVMYKTSVIKTTSYILKAITLKQCYERFQILINLCKKKIKKDGDLKGMKYHI